MRRRRPKRLTVSGNIASMSIAALRAEINTYLAAVAELVDVDTPKARLKIRRKMGRIQRLRQELAAKEAKRSRNHDEHRATC